MKKCIMIGGIIFIVLSILPFSTLTSASEEAIVKMQGSIMSIDVGKNIIIVNEKTFIWNQSTIFNNDRGSQIGVDKFTPKSWVFIEGERKGQSIVINKIYLLPKHVDYKERYRYPFMQ
ncbi:MAG: hypothetical protein WBN53_07355 [Thermodesulfobacteriota bacterium]